MATHELRQLIRLTYLIQPLLDAVDQNRLKVTLGVKLAAYAPDAQQIFYNYWTSRRNKGISWPLSS